MVVYPLLAGVGSLVVGLAILIYWRRANWSDPEAQLARWRVFSLSTAFVVIGLPLVLAHIFSLPA